MIGITRNLTYFTKNSDHHPTTLKLIVRYPLETKISNTIPLIRFSSPVGITTFNKYIVHGKIIIYATHYRTPYYNFIYYYTSPII